ncbi:hypothetical protein N4G70_34480 [Streptomyces sp. ASQP_92]|uniref:hypothetical protein n=1 Tax=Streptomyces sp. ASQP_92 TaxID=2979116 RepID=UPI0021C1B2D5|nr:hypothetical protein [Streptomyces sp. ASQP_92]MCT9093927.1 hypothetical protein [Streptomyces sp. ASQP_92]
MSQALALTEDRRRSTGESHQALFPLLTEPGFPLTIPAARHPEQAQLEADLFLACCKIGGLSKHPLGIVQVHPTDDQLTLRLLAEPYVLHYWAEFLMPRPNPDSDASHPCDKIIGVPGLRYRCGNSSICLYRPGMPANIVLTGFNPRWWERIIGRLAPDYGLFNDEPGWTSLESAAYSAALTLPFEPPSLFSPLLRRICATAGPGPINATDAWSSMGGIRLETTDGPPCPDLIRLVGHGPTGLGWQVERKRCTCLCDHPHGDVGCNITFREPSTGKLVYYSNGKWGRTLDDPRRREDIAEMNQAAFSRIRY